MARRRLIFLGILDIAKGETLQKVVHFGIQNLGPPQKIPMTPPLVWPDPASKGGGVIEIFLGGPRFWTPKWISF